MQHKMLAVLVAGALCAAGSGGQEKGKSDEDKIQATWTLVSLERMGMEVTEDFVKDAKVVFAAGKVKVQTQGKEMELTYKLDPSKKPRQIDVTETGDDGKERIHQ